ncbi:MAG: hypothetical protein L0229_29060 [Blastocatellia bacterium]|nr:hypothetical protein [Blastocatellia bacterium]
MPTYTFDTSVIIAYKVRELPQSFLLSAVVIAELTASATDESRRKVYEALRREFAKDNALIVPTEADWLTASRVLFWLSQERKRKPEEKLPDWQPGPVSACFSMP